MAEELPLLAGRYRLLERIGTGAMGVVWLAEDQRLHRKVAVKELVLPRSPAEAGDASARAMREGRIAARLLHPNAIAVFDVVEERDRPWLIMEYLPSTSLSEVLAARTRLPPDEVAAVGAQIASALAAAHRSGIVHRDVKPANVLLHADGTAKITDFGISRAAGDVTVTATGIVAGTPGYFAPEVARGADADSRSDVFSLGATLYHAVEGRPPFGTDDNAIAVLHRVGSGDYTPPVHAGALTPVLLSLLARDPADRPTMDRAAASLAELAGRLRPPEPMPAEPPAPAVSAPAAPAPASGLVAAPAPAPDRTRRRVWWLAAAVVLLLAGVVAAVWLNSNDNPGAAPPPASSSSTTAAPPPSPPPSTQPPTTTTTTTPTPNRAQQMEAAVRDYYALIPGNMDAAYARLTDRFKQQRTPTLAAYQGFFRQFSSVTVSDVAAQGDTVSASVTYHYANGGQSTERHTYTMVQGPAGWQIDSQASG